MKKLLNIPTIMFLAGGLLQACSGFLDENPEGQLAVSNSYLTEADAKAGVAAVYEGLQQMYERRMFLLTELPTDNMKNGTGMGNSQLQDLEYERHTAQNFMVRDVWLRSFNTIAKANVAIENVPKVSMDEDLKARLMGEAKFLRALYYFNLVRFHGDVPLVVKPVTTLADALAERAPESEVYAQIIKDLQDAEQDLPISYGPADSGRATRGAAKILLGKVYLTLGQFQNCVDKLAEVIDNEGTYGYGLHEDYADNWKIATELGQEMVFTVEFAQDLDGNVSMRLQAPRRDTSIPNAAIVLGISAADEADIPTQELFSIFDDEDERKFVTLRIDFVSLKDGSVHTSKIPLCVKYWEEGETDTGQSDNNMQVLRYSDALLMYAEALNEIDQTADAYEHINRVRERAFNSPDHNYSALTKEQFRDSVYLERRLELAFEAHRWFDLVRTGRLVQRMQDHAVAEAALSGEPIKLVIGDNIKDYMNKMPIPQDEVSVNPLLTQNTGY